MRSDKETVLDILGQPRTGENFDRKQTEKQLATIINAKNEQITILHQVNTRLGYELSLLQKKLGIDPFSILKELQKLGDISVTYHADLGQLQYLDQLLVAYDETILKQKKIIAMLYSQLEDSEKKAEAMVREKEYLLQENKNKCKKILQIYHRGFPQQNLTTAYIKLMRDMESEKNMLVREESEHIMDVYKQLQSRSYDLEKELDQEKLASTRFYESFKRQSEELKESIMSVDNLLKVKDFLEKTVNKLSEENINLETSKNDNEAKIGKLQGQVKSLRSQFFNQKKLSRQDVQRSSIEVDSMKSQLENAIKRQKESFSKMMLIEKQLETARDTTRSLKRQNQKIKSDFQQTLRMCEAYQSKITTLTRRDQNIRDVIDQSKQKLEGVLLQRDKALLKVQQLEKIMENMSERHRDELSRQRENYQKMLNQFQQKMRIVSDQKEECESIFMETQLGFKNQIEKLKRQNSILHEQNIKFVQNIRMSTGSQIINKLKQYESKNDSLTKILNQKERALKDSENKHQEAVHQYEGQIRNLNRLLEKEKNLTTQYMKELTQERSKANIFSNQKQCLQNEIKRLKKNNEYRNTQLNDDRQYRISDLEARLSEAIKKQKDTRAKAIEMLEKYDQAEQRLKGEYQKRIIDLQTQNEKVKKKLAKLRL